VKIIIIMKVMYVSNNGNNVNEKHNVNNNVMAICQYNNNINVIIIIM
jgi:hypothetical protein